MASRILAIGFIDIHGGRSRYHGRRPVAINVGRHPLDTAEHIRDHHIHAGQVELDPVLYVIAIGIDVKVTVDRGRSLIAEINVCAVLRLQQHHGGEVGGNGSVEIIALDQTAWEGGGSHTHPVGAGNQTAKQIGSTDGGLCKRFTHFVGAIVVLIDEHPDSGKWWLAGILDTISIDVIPDVVTDAAASLETEVGIGDDLGHGKNLSGLAILGHIAVTRDRRAVREVCRIDSHDVSSWRQIIEQVGTGCIGDVIRLSHVPTTVAVQVQEYPDAGDRRLGVIRHTIAVHVVPNIISDAGVAAVTKVDVGLEVIDSEHHLNLMQSSEAIIIIGLAQTGRKCRGDHNDRISAGGQVAELVVAHGTGDVRLLLVWVIDAIAVFIEEDRDSRKEDFVTINNSVIVPIIPDLTTDASLALKAEIHIGPTGCRQSHRVNSVLRGIRITGHIHTRRF